MHLTFEAVEAVSQSQFIHGTGMSFDFGDGFAHDFDGDAGTCWPGDHLFNAVPCPPVPKPWVLKAGAPTRSASPPLCDLPQWRPVVDLRDSIETTLQCNQWPVFAICKSPAFRVAATSIRTFNAYGESTWNLQLLSIPKDPFAAASLKWEKLWTRPSRVKTGINYLYFWEPDARGEVPHCLLTCSWLNGGVYVVDVDDERLPSRLVGLTDDARSTTRVTARGNTIVIAGQNDFTSTFKVFRGAGLEWTQTRHFEQGRTWSCLANRPCIALTPDGRRVVMITTRYEASVVNIEDGTVERTTQIGVPEPRTQEDVMAVEVCPGGLLVQRSSGVDFVPNDGGDKMAVFSTPLSYLSGTTALVPGLGLVVHMSGFSSTHMAVLLCQSEMDMAAMSPSRVAWMGTVARGIQRRHRARSSA